MAYCNNFVISLGQSGCFDECKTLGKGPSEFSKKAVIDISGSCDHCFAVLDDGRVFGRGSNYCCKLGLSPKTEPISSFVEIESLKMYKISSQELIILFSKHLIIKRSFLLNLKKPFFLLKKLKFVLILDFAFFL